ncbi:MBL fold metallo-hydrolase [Photobacterium sp. OFAV2-7]|uniref:MBL fold metallo-hydrolase n=1 Tax=Photobacterium sp. OFAV2-7 TaxID=2917748 RepID=UPI001EF63261|nr:MBL fold metallo-hydrolase [Photobacterium sp. OFAV2-7]MCG7588266.1 MBL fold metallo-hydrolase [Photobacterium sp. OFAV2-7]
MFRKIGTVVFSLVVTANVFAQEPVWDGNKVILESQKLASDVFAVIPSDAGEKAPNGYPIATTGGFVIGNDGVLVVESMLNERLAKQVISLVKKETSKPIKYVVNTSAHGDHSYGNYVFPDSVAVIQHVNAKQYIDSHFKQDTEFMMQYFGKGRGIEEVVPRTGDVLIPKDGKIAIDLGGKTVEIQDYGFAQTGGDLFVSVPADNVIWTGNPVVSTDPAFPWLLDGHLVETLATMRYVYGLTDAKTVVVPGHGPVTDRSAIKWHVDYLSAVRDAVKGAIAKGMSLEETVAAVQLPEYQGYALHGWVHSGLNVPAAYKDLSGKH